MSTTFEDLNVWKKSRILTLKLYKEINYNGDYNFKNQITKAAISISNNIAEGKSRKSDAEYKNFLRYAFASCAEVKSMIYLASDLNYLKLKKEMILLENCDEINKMINGLKKYLSKSLKPKAKSLKPKA
ncbi:MAG: four helix bundle protein [Bacteroidota bacterium]